MGTKTIKVMLSQLTWLCQVLQVISWSAIWTLAGADALEDGLFEDSAPIAAMFHPESDNLGMKARRVSF